MPRSERWNLVSADDLVAYHAIRRDIYRSLADLLTGPLSRVSLDRVTTRLAKARSIGPATRSLADLREVLAPATPEAISAELDRVRERGVLDCACLDAARATAFREARWTSTSGRPAELYVLAALAEDTARMLQAGDVAVASALADAQSHFVRDHAAGCFAELAAGLERTGGPILGALAAVLERQIDDDSESLGGSGGSSRCATNR